MTITGSIFILCFVSFEAMILHTPCFHMCSSQTFPTQAFPFINIVYIPFLNDCETSSALKAAIKVIFSNGYLDLLYLDSSSSIERNPNFVLCLSCVSGHNIWIFFAIPVVGGDQNAPAHANFLVGYNTAWKLGEKDIESHMHFTLPSWLEVSSLTKSFLLLCKA